MIWASAKLKNYRDWSLHIDNTKAIRVADGRFMGEQTFEYFTNSVHGTTAGHDVDVAWKRSERLDKILQAAAFDVVKNSNEQIGKAATEPGSRTTDAYAKPGSSTPLLAHLPQASGKTRFADGKEPVLYTLYQQRKRTGYSSDAIFYTFTPNAAYGAPDGYVLVGGADFNTYAQVFETKNVIVINNADGYGGRLARNLQPNTAEVLLARKADLVDVK